MTELETKARDFAAKAHAGQVRKYTGEPYLNHCAEVVEFVRSVPHTDEMLAAAWLHDTVEDCGVTLQTILEEFGLPIMNLVGWLTDVSKPSDGNRATRKAIDCEHTAQASPDAKTIKLADLISNTLSIAERDPKFAKVYLPEKLALLGVLREGDVKLWNIAFTLAKRKATEILTR